MRYMVKFSKIGVMRFIGHLDLLRTLQRSIKRARLPVAYSKGFNPHQLVSFASPLPVGMTGLSEIVELELSENASVSEIKDRLNNCLPDGILILAVREMASSEKSTAALLAAARFEIKPYVQRIEEAVADAMASSEIIVEKNGKKGISKVNIRQEIYEMRVERDSLEILIAQGSQKSIKPSLAVKYLWEHLGEDYESSRIAIARGELFKENILGREPLFIPLFMAGESE